MTPELTADSTFSLHEISLPAEKLEDKEFRHFFMDAMAGKIASYQEMYGNRVVAFDRTDLLSRHFLVCRNTETRQVPVSGFQVFEMETREKYEALLPGLSISQYSKAIQHERYIKSQIKKSKSEGRTIHWYGGFFRVPGTLNREELKLSRSLNSTMIIGHIKQSTALAFSFTSLKANIYKYYHSLGFTLCDFLPAEPLTHPNYPSDLKLIRFDGFKEDSMTEFEGLQNFWEARKQW